MLFFILGLIVWGFIVGGLLWLTRLHPGTHYVTGEFGPMAVLGIGGGLGFVPLNAVIMAAVPPADAGAAGGALQTMQQVGSTLGLTVLVTAYGSVLRGGDGSPAATVHAMTVAFTIAAGIAAVGVLVALTFRRPTPAVPSVDMPIATARVR